MYKNIRLYIDSLGNGAVLDYPWALRECLKTIALYLESSHPTESFPKMINHFDKSTPKSLLRVAEFLKEQEHSIIGFRALEVGDKRVPLIGAKHAREIIAEMKNIIDSRNAQSFFDDMSGYHSLGREVSLDDFYDVVDYRAFNTMRYIFGKTNHLGDYMANSLSDGFSFKHELIYGLLNSVESATAISSYPMKNNLNYKFKSIFTGEMIYPVRHIYQHPIADDESLLGSLETVRSLARHIILEDYLNDDFEIKLSSIDLLNDLIDLNRNEIMQIDADNSSSLECHMGMQS